MNLPVLFLIILEVTSISKKKELQVNHEIRAREVRVINPKGDQLGVMPINKALQAAQDMRLDLVKVSNSKPPVCKIMDYGKYRYEQNKREKEAKKKQRVINVKEIRMNPNIEDHDFQVRVKNATRFLKNGDKVKVSIKFRGREITHSKLGEELLERMAESVKDLGFVEKRPKVEGRNMSMVISPKDIKAKE